MASSSQVSMRPRPAQVVARRRSEKGLVPPRTAPSLVARDGSMGHIGAETAANVRSPGSDERKPASMRRSQVSLERKPAVGSSRRPSVSKSSTLPALERHREKVAVNVAISSGNQAAGDQSSPEVQQAPPAPPAAHSAWDMARFKHDKQPPDKLQELIRMNKAEWVKRAQDEHDDALARARTAWQVGDLAEADEKLGVAIRHSPSNDMLQRFRSRVSLAAGRLDDALNAAGSAVASSPGNPRNHHALAIASQRKDRLEAAGTAYLTAMGRGMYGSADKLGFTGYLNTVRRQRNYYTDIRPAHRKAVNSSTFLARTPSRASIFDPEKTLDEEEVAAEDQELPEPPQLKLIKAETNSVTVGWSPSGTNGAENITIYAYELEMAQYDVVWEG